MRFAELLLEHKNNRSLERLFFRDQDPIVAVKALVAATATKATTVVTTAVAAVATTE